MSRRTQPETFAVEVLPTRHAGVDDREPPTGMIITPFRAPPVRLVRAVLFGLASRLEAWAARHGSPWAISCDGEEVSLEFVHDGDAELLEGWRAVFEVLGTTKRQRRHPVMASGAMFDLPLRVDA